MKRFVILLLTAVLALTMPLSALAAGQIEVTEDISVSDDYDWTRFKGQNVTLNVYNWASISPTVPTTAWTWWRPLKS